MHESLDQIKQVIRDRSDLFEQHFGNADAGALVRDYYVEDPIMSAPEIPPLRGQDAITGLFEELFKSIEKCRLEQVAVEVLEPGYSAYEISRAWLYPKDGSAPVTPCRYMILWRKCQDTWRVAADFFAYGEIPGENV